MPQQIQDGKRVIVEFSLWIVVTNNCAKSFDTQNTIQHHALNPVSYLLSTTIEICFSPGQVRFSARTSKAEKICTNFLQKYPWLSGTRTKSSLFFIWPDSRHGRTLSCSLSGTCGANECISWQGIKTRHSTIVGFAWFWRPKSFKLEPMETTVFSFLTRMVCGPHLTKSFCLDLKCFKNMMCKKRLKS